LSEENWFEDARFGMFITWGLYSQQGGLWNGKKYYGISEWLMRRAKIKGADYKKIANDFNPVGFDAKEWVAIAKEAGVKYIIITAKFHDGFAMFDSALSDMVGLAMKISIGCHLGHKKLPAQATTQLAFIYMIFPRIRSLVKASLT
jgi:hypothetical protein